MCSTELTSELVPIVNEEFQFFLNCITMRTNHVIHDFVVFLSQLLIFLLETLQFLSTSNAPKSYITSIFVVLYWTCIQVESPSLLGVNVERLSPPFFNVDCFRKLYPGGKI